MNAINLDLAVPFPTKRHAEIAYHVLRVDAEPKRSGVTKQVLVEENILHVKLSAGQARQLRVATNGVFESINLILETFEFAGDPVSEAYNHFE